MTCAHDACERNSCTTWEQTQKRERPESYWKSNKLKKLQTYTLNGCMMTSSHEIATHVNVLLQCDDDNGDGDDDDNDDDDND